MKLIDQIIGSTAIALRVTSTSYAISFEKECEGNWLNFSLQTNADVKIDGEKILGFVEASSYLARVIDKELREILVQSQYTLTLNFVDDIVIMLSIEGLPVDNLAIIKDELSGEWGLIS